MEIAKGFTTNDYKKLDLSKSHGDDWSIVIDVLNKRIINRFIAPIDVLLEAEKGKNPINKKFGFAVLAIDCLLIETI